MREVFNGGDWTIARFNSFVKSALRSASQRWPPKYQCLNAAKRGKKINWRTGKLAEHYQCNSCSKEFPLKEVQVDHKNPIVPVTGFVSWDEVINNMFCEQDNLQVLCKECHNTKSQVEKTLRKEYKNAKQ